MIHTIDPVFDENSRILILGSFPSVMSREIGFFYGHGQNRFWKVISYVFGEVVPITIEEKKAFLIKNRIALWDVIGSCDIIGSSDLSIKNVKPNDLDIILCHAKIEKIFTNGGCADKYYQKYIKDKTKRDAIRLPSSSPANAAWSLEKLKNKWKSEINP